MANNNRPDRGANKKAGNAPKLSAAEQRDLLAKQLGIKPRTKAFVDELIGNKGISQTEAYIRTHETSSRSTAAVEASKTLRKPNVQIYKDRLVRRAKERMGELVESGNENVAFKAAADIIDRTEGKAVQKTENTSKIIEVKLDLSGARLGAHYIRPEQLPAIEPEA